MDNNKRLCAMEPRLRLKRSPPQAGLELGTQDRKNILHKNVKSKALSSENLQISSKERG